MEKSSLKVKANDSWALTLVKVATHGVTNLLSQAIQIVSLGKDGCAQSACCITAFRRILHKKDKLVHPCASSSTVRCPFPSRP
jgi:hypothetical protein